MKNTFSNIAAIVKFNDDDIRVIQDKFIKFPKKYIKDVNQDDVMYEFAKFSNNPSVVEEIDIKHMIQVLANIESNASDIKMLNYMNGNILFTIGFEDDIDENIRNSIIDVKCFREHFAMQIFMNKEFDRVNWESFRARIMNNESLSVESN